MKIGTNDLKDIKYISLILENCEAFDIDTKYILDILFDDIHTDVGHGRDNEVYDGRLVLSKDCLDLLSDIADLKSDDGTKGIDTYDIDPLKLRNRLLNYCDITQVHIHFNDGTKIRFSVPYDPLEEEMHGNEIDLSNCPSAELDENDNVLILFGKSSHSYKRVDNNYADLIIGFDEEFPDRIKKTLKVRLQWISNIESYDFCPRLFVDMYVRNKAYRNQYLKLVFEDIKRVSINLYPKLLKKTVRMKSSRISSGDIFVEFGKQIHFYCQCIKTYEVYSNNENNISIGDYRDYKNLLTTEYNKLKTEKIGLKDFRNWLESLSKDIQYDR